MQTELKISVDWAELDLFGHVNNVMFFKYMQTARVHFCEKAGLNSTDVHTQLGFMVASGKCQFRKPLHYPGELTIITKCDWVKNTSFQLSYRLEKDSDLIAEGEDVIVVYDHKNKCKVVMKESLRIKLLEV